MSLSAVATAASTKGPTAGAPPRVRSRFHVWLGLWMLAIVVIGFWPTYFAPTLRGTLAIPTVVHAHGLVFLGWMTLLVAQVINVGDMVSFAVWFGAAIWYRARPEVHKRLMVVATARLDHAQADPPVDTIGSIALFLFGLRLLVAGSETWLRIGGPSSMRCDRLSSRASYAASQMSQLRTSPSTASHNPL